MVTDVDAASLTDSVVDFGVGVDTVANTFPMYVDGKEAEKLRKSRSVFTIIVSPS